MEYEVVKGVTRVAVEQLDTLITDFNLSDPKRLVKAQMIGKLTKTGISYFKYRDIQLIARNSNKVIILGHDELVLPYLSAIECIFGNIKEPDLFSKIFINNNKSKYPYIHWDYTTLSAINNTPDHYNKNYWGYDDLDSSDQSLVRVFAIAWSKLHNIGTYEKRFDTLSKYKTKTISCDVISDISGLIEVDRYTMLARIATTPDITLNYNGSKLCLVADIKTLTNALFDVEIQSNYEILPIHIMKLGSDYKFNVTILSKSSNTLDIINDAIIKHNIKIGNPGIYV